MASFEMVIDHELSEAEALKRVKKLITDTKKEHSDLIDNLKEKWTDNTGTFSATVKGYALSGTITVGAPVITLKGEIPWALSFMKGKMEKLIAARAKELFA